MGEDNKGDEMTAPKVRPWNPLPDQMVPVTYPQYVNKLKCSCPMGALIQPPPLPSATLNLGDIIADQARILSAFTSAYGVITAILKMIACIIEVLCCLTNPFCLIFAIIFTYLYILNLYDKKFMRRSRGQFARSMIRCHLGVQRLKNKIIRNKIFYRRRIKEIKSNVLRENQLPILQ
jgi:hypothetical protein